MEGSVGRPRRLRRCPTSPWTDDRIECLKLRWSQGASARQIARELGAGISRSAVLAKIYRLGIVELSPHGGGGGKQPPANNKRRTPDSTIERQIDGTRFWQARLLPSWVLEAKPYADDPLLDADIPVPQRRSFLELSSRTCRWPVGDPVRPNSFFCGAQPSPGKPYCAAHCVRAYRRPADGTSPPACMPASGGARIQRLGGHEAGSGAGAECRRSGEGG